MDLEKGKRRVTAQKGNNWSVCEECVQLQAVELLATVACPKAGLFAFRTRGLGVDSCWSGKLLTTAIKDPGSSGLISLSFVLALSLCLMAARRLQFLQSLSLNSRQMSSSLIAQK